MSNAQENKVREIWVKNQCILIDEEMWPIVNKFTWHIKPDKKTYYAFTNIRINGKNCGLSMHRLLTGISSSEIDHKNRNGLDNRIDNLRFASKSQNSCNRIRKNKYGFRGVYVRGGKKDFSVQIQFEDKKIHKHGFKTAIEAAKEYDKLSKELHGEFGIRNFKD